MNYIDSLCNPATSVCIIVKLNTQFQDGQFSSNKLYIHIKICLFKYMHCLILLTFCGAPYA